MRVSEFDEADADVATDLVAVWAAIPHWVEAVVAGRPYGSVDAVAARADALARDWSHADLDAALAHHPRIGEKPRGSGDEAAASRGEQAAVARASDDVTAAIAAANADYEERFGRVFLIRAAGRSPEEILAEARRRLGNDADTEADEALDQLRQIALLRLRSSLEDAPAMTPTSGTTPHVTTHILDATAGAPAAGVAIVLADAEGTEVARGTTDADGRLGLGPAALAPGEYALTFATGAYFAGREVATFYPSVTIRFTVADAPHYHVPLLLSPFGYSTYRGS